jgi:hypothetical protein
MIVSVGSLFALIITLLVVGILVWLAFYVLQQFAPPEPVGRIIRVVVVVVAVLVLVAVLLNVAGMGPGIRLSALHAPWLSA